MNIDVYIGLAATSHNPGMMCQAVFSDVTMTGSISGDWSSRDIGIVHNDPQKFYVALEDSDNVAVMKHEDPNVVQTSTWTEWRIDLNDFRKQGIDLRDIRKIYIGFGDRSNPQPGGSGIVYIDDIRLHGAEFLPGKLPPMREDLVYDGVINYADLDILADNWLLQPADPNIDLYDDGKINFRDIAELGSVWHKQQVWPAW